MRRIGAAVIHALILHCDRPALDFSPEVTKTSLVTCDPSRMFKGKAPSYYVFPSNWLLCAYWVCGWRDGRLVLL